MDYPKRDWRLYEDSCRAEHALWLRGLTAAASWELYQSLFEWGHLQQAEVQAGKRRLEQARWNEKLEVRRRLCAAFGKLDQMRHERLAAANSK